MNTNITALEPKPIWENFSALNDVPRPSKKEERVIEFIKNFGENLGLETFVDPTGNVVIKKPATQGKEDRPTVILQSHLDMVHQKNADTVFDFDNQGIRSFIDGEWVTAEGTTLGADNGIGVASIMSLLQSKDIPHPALEALFTIDEETGMTGAKGLQEGMLDGKILLNLDSEEDDELTIGCAGGVNTNTYYHYKVELTPANSEGFHIKVSGLKGGHSGIDIHIGRANANKLMNRLLYQTTHEFGMRIGHIDGGSLRNAIPRESQAVITVPSDKKEAFLTEFEQRKALIVEEFKDIEPNINIEITPHENPGNITCAEDQERILNAIYAVPNGVFRMTPSISGLVETSNNLARVIVKDGDFTTQSLQRSSVESGKKDVANAVRAPFELIGARIENDSDYPGWAPNSSSNILSTMVEIYEELFGSKPKVAACHAGLECGIIGQHYPGLDMISFGPTIHHAHSPDEKVNISSVQKFWKYLVTTLDRV